MVNGRLPESGDSMAVGGVDNVLSQGGRSADVLLFDLP
jgi:hypothetical protein